MSNKGLELYAPREATHVRTWTLAAIVLFLIFLFLGMGINELSVSVLKLRRSFGSDSWGIMFCQLFFGFGLGALFCFLWIGYFEKRGLDTIGFKAGGLTLYLRGLLIGFGFISAVVGVIYLLGGYQVSSAGIAANFNVATVAPLVLLFFGFMVQGATEEIFMRGWIFQLITSRHGVVLGIIGNMLIFSLIHGLNIEMSTELLIGLFNIVLVAILLSFYALKEGTLWGVCAWHSAWNWLLGVGFGLEVSGQPIKVTPLLLGLENAVDTPVWLNGGKFGPEASVVTSVVLLLGIVYFGTKKGHGRVFSVPGEMAVDIRT